MLRLAINTASTTSQIALTKMGPDHKILGCKCWQKHQAENLLPSLEEMLQNNNYSFSDISEIIVVKGPGTFTGLRVGVTTANTLAYLNKAKLYGVSTFSLFEQIADNLKIDLPEILIFAGARGVYHHQKNTSLADLELKLPNLAPSSTFCGDLSLEQQSLLPNFTDFTDYSLALATNKYLENNKIKSEIIIRPLYVKDPNITRSKKTLI